MNSAVNMFRNGQHHVVGRGRLGKTLENGLQAAGRDLTSQVRDADVIWFCVPESALREAFEELSGQLRPESIRLHTSGFLPASVLKDNPGSLAGSLHPAYSFHKPLSDMPSGILWTFEGSSELTGVVAELTEYWGGTLHTLDEDQKAAYHIICVLLANLTAIPLTIARNLSDSIGLPFSRLTESLLLPVLGRIQATDTEPMSHLTGPAARGDENTVQKQVDWLMEQDSVAADVYRVLSEAIRRYRDQGSDSDADD